MASQTALFSKEVSENKMSICISSATLVWNVSHPKKNFWGMIKNGVILVQYPLLLSDFN